MEIVAGTGVGLVLRAFLYLSGLSHTKAGAAALGFWEGAILHGTVRQPRRASHATADQSETDAYAALALKLVLDLLATGSVARVAIVAMCAGLGVVLVEVGERVLEESGTVRVERSSRHRHRPSSVHYSRWGSSHRAASRTTARRDSDVCSTDSAFSPVTSPQVERSSTPFLPSAQAARSDTTAPSAHDVPPITVPDIQTESTWRPLELSDILATPGGVYSPARARGTDSDWVHLSQPGLPTQTSPTLSDAEPAASSSSSSLTPQGTPVRLTRPPLGVDLSAPAPHSGATPTSSIKMLPPVLGSPFSRPAVLISPLDSVNPTIKVALSGAPASVASSAATASGASAPAAAPVVTVEVNPPTMVPQDLPATPQPAAAPAPAVAQVVTVEVHPPTPPRDPLAAEQPAAKPTPAPAFSYAAVSARTPVVTVNTVPAARPAPRVPPSEAGTEIESVVSTANRDGLLLRADRLRTQAREEEAAREALETQRRAAIREGRSIEALRLKVRREEAFARAARLHRRAERRYHLAHNATQKPHVIDIHGLKVREALRRVERALRDAIVENAGRLRVITGRGNHSKDNIPVLKNAVIEAMREHQIPVKINPTNPGELWIVLTS